MIYKGRHVRFFQWIALGVEKYLLSGFAKITFINFPSIDKEKATFVLMNHFSMNDGALLYHVNRKMIKKKFNVMSLEDQMEKFPLLKYIGSFSVNKKSRSLIKSIDNAASLLGDPKNMFGFFPQGDVYSQHLNQVHFEKGLELILKKNKHEVQTIFVVLLLDFLGSFKPKANLYFKEYEGVMHADGIEKAYNVFYKECKTEQRRGHNPPESIVD